MKEPEDEIAIVGIGCNFPGGEGIDNFWKVLVEGRNCTIEIPPERFNTRDWYDPDDSKPGKIRTTQAALIDGFNKFDNRLFGINDVEADSMDPQQKLLLECTYRALENAGIPLENISGSKTGVFIGLMNRDYEMIHNRYPLSISHYNGTGTAMSIAANRISYCFNLTGPSLIIDTACSSSLVALHYACHAIKQGDCEMAVCGGVSCILEPRNFVVLSKAKMISPDGTSKPFSRKADGYGRGEGCGMVVLKPLRKAEENCDKIWGVISFSAVNQDGRSVTPITKPSQTQQEKLLLGIYTTHINPSLVQYVEAHGTGTPVGDPAEAASLSTIIAKKRSPGSSILKIGSVKGNIGHTESAAGVAGLIKVLLMMQHRVIVPSLHYSIDISSINPEEFCLSIPTAPEEWKDPGKQARTAGINCFGFGGTNAHVVVRQHNQRKSVHSVKRPLEIFVLSAASSKSLKLALENAAQQLSKLDSVTLQDLAYTSACRRSHTNYKFRKAFVTFSLKQLQQQLAIASNNEIIPEKANPQLVFVFCGNGVTYKGMCKTLLRTEPVFREKCKEIENMLHAYAPISIVDLIENEYDDFSKPEIAQQLLFAIQVALVSLLTYWGVKPVSIIGHSVGEVAAAHCAGRLSLQDAVKVIYYRSTLQSKVTGGKMLVVGNVPVQEVLKLLDPYSGKVSIAAFNSPQSCTLSGDADLIDKAHQQLVQLFSSRNVFLHLLDVPAAYHSHMMDPILKEIEESLSDLESQKPETELVSTVTGRIASDQDFTVAKYWARNIREPVAFEKALLTAAKGRENLMLVEIGPRRALQRNIVEVLGETTSVFPAVQPNKEYETIFTLIGNLFSQGYSLDMQHFYEGYKTIPTSYPTYQFDHRKTEEYSENNATQSHSIANSSHPLLQSVSKGNTEFSYTVSEALTPYVYEHKNNDIVIVPGSLYVELVLASVMSSSKPKMPLSAHQVSIIFSSPCVISQNSHDLKVQLESNGTVTNFKIQSSHSVYATGTVKQNVNDLPEEDSISLENIFQRCKKQLVVDKIYESLSETGFQYGQVYKQMHDVFFGEDLSEAVAKIKVNEEITKELHNYYIHPVVLDNFLQMTVVVANVHLKTGVGFPSAIGTLVVFRPLQNEMLIYLRACKITQNYILVCGCFTDKGGWTLAEFKNVKITKLGHNSSKLNNLLFESRWKEMSQFQKTKNSEEPPKALVFADTFGIADLLKKHLHKESTYIMYKNWETELHNDNSGISILHKKKIHSSDYREVLFMWGIHRFCEEFPDNLVQYLSKCCDAYRQIILSLKEQNYKVSIRTITFRTTDKTVDHINPGFVLQGMTRSCLTELKGIHVQLIDISSSNVLDITSLAEVIINTKGDDYAEIWIDEGKIYFAEITRTVFPDISNHHLKMPLQSSQSFILQTEDPYRVAELSAESNKPLLTKLTNHSVEIQIHKICSHSEDYFPVTISSAIFGNTLYWNRYTIKKHQLLALDFSGTVTATGTEVRKVKVGDCVVSCYPVLAASKVTLPEMACYNTKKVSFLRNVPCVSYFMIAWTVLHQTLPKVKGHPSLAVITPEPASVMCQVLTLTAEEIGWRTVVGTPVMNQWQYLKQCSALVFLPPQSGIPKEELSRLLLVKDIVIVCDNQKCDYLRNLTGSCHEHVQVHMVSLHSIFQKANLTQSQKLFYQWIKSMSKEIFLNLSSFIFQQNGNAEGTSSKGSSYFTCKSIPVIVLKDDLLNNKISNILMHGLEGKLFRHDAAYIVAGGLTGLGFETVKFIAQHGGGSIVILSRRNPPREKQEEIKMLQNQWEGTRIITIQCNVAFPNEVKNALNSIAKMFSKIPIKGIFHSAVVLHDGFLETLSLSHFEKVLNPKIAGAINLHCATRDQELDYFVCYSSVSSFIGNSAQANYAAANSFLDMFCHYRRNRGLSGQSICWGALNLGLLLNRNHLQHILESKGILTLDLTEVNEYLEKSLVLNNSQQVVMKLDFKSLYEKVISETPALNQRSSAILQEELSKLEDKSELGVLQTLSAVKPEEYIIKVISELSNVSTSDITLSTSPTLLGLDSMLAITLQNRISHDRKVNVPLVKILDPNTTISSLALLLEDSYTEKVKPENSTSLDVKIEESTRL
ncbi:highly reducing polyketide synthase SAT13 [Microcaecilia unicolor]|uniref:Highly reducing polyketide synthase SAT13-like n=1 Tax=Microcaecilia unicolor TaxID=1415580 RepID=A0A6P7XI16_9AMPH|nr:highly reducing polyketide synthase SAT13-like [Microcaecilia unicolor]